MSDASEDWSNYRRFINHKNALSLIFNYSPPQLVASQRNADEQFDQQRAADEEGISVSDYLRGPTSEY